MNKPTLIAKITFNQDPSPNHYDHLKYIAEKELNRTPYLSVEVIESGEAYENARCIRSDEMS